MLECIQSEIRKLAEVTRGLILKAITTERDFLEEIVRSVPNWVGMTDVSAKNPELDAWEKVTLST
jgi:hypothetical protein